MKIVYFAHDISHPDVLRKVDVMELGGAEVVLIGFQRMDRWEDRPGKVTISLGRTEDGKFTQRIGAVLQTGLKLGKHVQALRGAQGIIARNLEMLVLAAVARARFLPGVAMTYECIDIHRFQSASGPVGTAMRGIEAALLRRSHAIVTSSPGFIREYFSKVHRQLPKAILLENKVWLEPGETRERPEPPRQDPPWRIGWYGNIRCKRSLDMLAEVGRRRPGLIEVVIAGRPSQPIFGDVEKAFSGLPGIRFIGPFVDKKSAGLYKSVDFTWAMDFYEAGGNSDWLLPNRLYRAVYYGAVPLAVSSVETGRWLTGHDIGMILDEANPDSLIAAFEALTAERFAAMQRATARVRDAELAFLPEECRALVADLTQQESWAGQPATAGA